MCVQCYICRYDVRENEVKILNMTQNLKTVTEERDKLQLLASQHYEIVKNITEKGEAKISALQVNMYITFFYF